MPTSKRRVAWDTCVIIRAIEKRGDDYGAISQLIGEAEAGELLIVISEMSVVEVSKLQSLDNEKVPLKDQHRLIDDWLENEYIVRRPVTPQITANAVSLAREHNLTCVDSVILATAIQNRVSELHTGDGSGRHTGKRLIPLSGKYGVRICRPKQQQMQMDFEGGNTKSE